MTDGGTKEYDSMGREVKTFSISMVDEGTMLSIAITCFVIGVLVGAVGTWACMKFVFN